jgi:hypothetical protein
LGMRCSESPSVPSPHAGHPVYRRAMDVLRRACNKADRDHLYGALAHAQVGHPLRLRIGEGIYILSLPLVQKRTCTHMQASIADNPGSGTWTSVCKQRQDTAGRESGVYIACVEACRQSHENKRARELWTGLSGRAAPLHVQMCHRGCKSLMYWTNIASDLCAMWSFVILGQRVL